MYLIYRSSHIRYPANLYCMISFKLRSFMAVFFNLGSSPFKGAYEGFREHANIDKLLTCIS
ncbi:hypothetical protein T01_3914 [Trichinella spiralis]|uniref:Uncharacterized protein n=1 Tax=Trichinella spiralis TaxID=6334 RepID=A0A0V1BT15_TRISP|nr:hypothetical protein T01_3914 [Trichinella spiralis]